MSTLTVHLSFSASLMPKENIPTHPYFN